MNTAMTTYRPGLLGRSVFDDAFNNFFTDFPRHMRQSTRGYPVADIYQEDDGSTVLEFALAGFTKEDLTVDVQPDKRSITVSANAINHPAEKPNRRIAKRAFSRTYVNYDDNLDLYNARATFENGLLTVRVNQRPELKPHTIEIE